MVDLDPSIVRGLIEDHESMREHLLGEGQISFASTLASSVPKVAVLSAASWIEDRVQRIVLEYFEEAMPSSPHGVHFVRSTGVARQYHTWFDWKTTTATRFFSLFGPDFKAFCMQEAKQSPSLDDDIKSFIELGRLRNTLVHENFAAHQLSNSLAEVNDLFEGALRFVEKLPGLLRQQAVAGD